MLEFFQKYQKVFFIFVAIVVIASFSFFGTFETFMGEERQEERVIGETVDGAPLKLSEVQLLARLLSSDQGNIVGDLLQTGVADLLVKAYFEPLKEELQSRLDRAKRYRPYAHPLAPYLSQTLAWTQFFPAILQEYRAFLEEKETTPQTFSHLSKLYQQQKVFPPELLRKCLAAQQKQMEGLQPDPGLLYADLSLFGFHTLTDWFGSSFINLAAQFILNGAAVAEMKGFRVSLEEAKGDLLRSFGSDNVSLGRHLREGGFDEKSTCEAWRKVLLFRRYFQSLSQAALIDRLPFSNFASYALETAVVDHYTWPPSLHFKSAQDRAEFEAYLQAVSPESALEAPPTTFYSLDEIEKHFPSLVQTTYRAQVAEISKDEIALHASIQEIWDWQLEESNWRHLKEKFSFLSDAASREGRFTALEKLEVVQRSKVDRFSRFCLLDLHPEWISDAIAAAQREEKTFSVAEERAPFPHIENAKEFAAAVQQAMQEGNPNFQYSDDGRTIYFVENLERCSDRHLLTFEEAKKQGILAGKKPSKAVSSRLLTWTEKAYEDLKNGIGAEVAEESSKQFQLIRAEKEIQRTGKEGWMKNQVFDMIPEQWSSIHESEEGEVSFFFLKEKRTSEDPILEQLYFGKQLISADAQRYLAERFLEIVKKRNAIVIPVEGAL